MTDENATPEPVAEPEPRVPVTPPQSRFLYVDVAALRAKQLRRGALPRLEKAAEGDTRPEPHKPERVAMEEVRRGLVSYQVPELKPPTGGPHS